jgi:molybdopterin-guanine dinucleotide biosynthesis protein A
MITSLPCVIFAGGKSSRMGEDKALLPFGDSPTLSEYQLLRLSKLFSDIYISCNTKEKFSFQAKFIEDKNETDIAAPTFGFLSVFEALEVERFFVISVDSPFVNETVIRKLIQEDCASYDATVAMTKDGVQPLCGVYHRSLEKEFLQMKESNSHKLGYLLKKSRTEKILFADDRAFLNLNNPQEYQEALQYLP